MTGLVKPAQKIDGTGAIHLTTLGRGGTRVLVCSGRSMYGLVPTTAPVTCKFCLRAEAGATRPEEV